MMEGPIPCNYDEWQHCITVECGIPLTAAFIDERIASMQTASEFRTQQFVKLYGPQYHRQVLSWFHEAKEKLETQ
ncbi:MAG: hypothetical protein ACJASG_000887 [Oleiphilaceae bacterium]|jgi:hypothetical protein